MLKSFPGKSFRNTRNSGGDRPSSQHFLYMMLMISETAMKVFGLDAHPRSAMVMVSGKSVQQKSNTACFNTGIDRDRQVDYKNQSSQLLLAIGCIDILLKYMYVIKNNRNQLSLKLFKEIDL